MIFLTRRERFSAAHRMYRKDWSDSRNYEVFGKCSNPEWHGHNYTLYITVKGEIDSERGFLINLSDLKEIINDAVISKLDHRNINTEVDFMKDKIATTENLAVAIWDVLQPLIEERGVLLHRVRIEETENNSVDYYG